MPPCSGKAWFYRESRHGKLKGYLADRRLSCYEIVRSGKKEKMHFIENRNLHSCPWKGRGLAVAVREKTDNSSWYLGIVFDILPLQNLISYYEWNGKSFNTLSSKTDWGLYSTCFRLKTVSLSNTRVIFVNQFWGRRAGDVPLSASLVNKSDGKLQCLTSGPDVLLPVSIRGDYKGRVLHPPSLSVSQKLLRKNARKEHNKYFACASKNMDHQKDTFYIEDLGQQRIDPGTATNEELLSVPYLARPKRKCCILTQHPKQCKIELSYALFAVVPMKVLKQQLLKRHLEVIPEEHDKILDRIKVDQTEYLEVDEIMHSQGIRLRLVKTAFFQHNAPLDKHSCPLIAHGFESGPVYDPVSTCTGELGICISQYIRCSEANPVDVTFDDLKTIREAYGNGFGNRRVSVNIGHQMFQGKRTKKNPSLPSPVQGPKMSSQNQIYRKFFHGPLQVKAEKMTSHLGGKAVSVASMLDCSVHSVLPGGRSRTNLLACRKKILTFGKEGECVAFANTKHSDRDGLSQVDEGKIYARMNQAKKSSIVAVQKKAEYVSRWKQYDRLGVSTTCVYQAVSNIRDEHSYHLYFLMDGIGIAVRLHSHILHMFYGHSFSHHTAVTCLIVGGKVTYSHDMFNIFAWGAGGKE